MFQSNRFGNTPPIVLNLIIINALFLLVTVVLKNQEIDIVSIFGLHSFYSSEFRIWQPLTNIFLHGDIGHLFFNMFSLWMFGRILEQVWGDKKFLIFFLFTGVGASLLNSIVNIAEVEYARYAFDQAISNLSPDTFFSILKSHQLELKPEVEAYFGNWYKNPSSPEFINQAKEILLGSKVMYVEALSKTITIGASGAVYGVLLAFGVLFPNMTLMLIIPPVPIKAKYMVMIFAAFELYFGISGKQPGIAHFAHLGGMLIAFIILRYWKKHNMMY